MGECRVCDHQFEAFISFGKQPIANGFISEADLPKEYFFELKVGFCPNCKTVQLEDQPDPELMFNENYAFFSGTSAFMAKHFEKYADYIKQNHLKSSDPFVVEIGSNDGIMLRNCDAWLKKGR